MPRDMLAQKFSSRCIGTCTAQRPRRSALCDQCRGEPLPGAGGHPAKNLARSLTGSSCLSALCVTTTMTPLRGNSVGDGPGDRATRFQGVVATFKPSGRIRRVGSTRRRECFVQDLANAAWIKPVRLDVRLDLVEDRFGIALKFIALVDVRILDAHRLAE